LKKSILIIFTCLHIMLMTACGLGQGISAENTSTSDSRGFFAGEGVQEVSDSSEEVLESETVFYDIHEIQEPEKNYWENADSPVLDDCLDDVETASSVAKLILARFQRKGLFSGYSLQYIEYQSDPEIWVFSFWDGDSNETGASFNMAIRKDNAQVLKMWVSE